MISEKLPQQNLKYTYTYDTSGNIRTVETTNTKTNKTTQFIYDNGGAPYSVIYSRGNEVDTYYYILNQQGDVIRIVDTSGKTVSEYTYNGWGEILNVSNAKGSEIGTINPILYRGYYYDSELNMYYLQSRYYDPVMKRKEVTYIAASAIHTTVTAALDPGNTSGGVRSVVKKIIKKSDKISKTSKKTVKQTIKQVCRIAKKHPSKSVKIAAKDFTKEVKKNLKSRKKNITGHCYNFLMNSGRWIAKRLYAWRN